MSEPHDITICILAGGEATRLPGKLALEVGEVPMLVRVFRNLARDREVWISTKGSLPPEIDAQLDAPMVVDRWPKRGPLSGLLSTMSEMRSTWVFACAGDAPFVDAAFVDELATSISPELDAIVPAHAQDAKRIEPLAALYRREAFLREGTPILLGGEGALRLVIDRLRTRFVPARNAAVFTNVNTPADYAGLRGAAV
ncbi:MAG TPA: molybdenum cofactor guanylyltransferase [Candidatus Sulfotelmatobacter sp.]|nr:molybdenum cofactor guanylyltransferase [Candidatus Sulfotelmatobacter sp.]